MKSILLVYELITEPVVVGSEIGLHMPNSILGNKETKQ